MVGSGQIQGLKCWYCNAMETWAATEGEVLHVIMDWTEKPNKETALTSLAM